MACPLGSNDLVVSLALRGRKRYSSYLLQSSYIDMANFLIDFEWFRCPDGYQIVNARESARARGGRPTSYPHGDWIVPKSEDKIPCRPLDRFDTLCNVFAKVKTSDELL